jgi:DNA polymerase-3 subunit gamma/tau
MAEALYRKYRSKSFADVVGQEHITQTLERSIKKNKISHAYLFSGPRGVGKTSVARILAYAVNDFKYSDDDTNYLDIIELDAASNRKIEDMKQLIDRVWLAPSDGKYKVFIIDEVHMLTKDAFNALLKTLEEPPEYVIFILATTEAHKVPETILSRTQQFTFRPIGRKNVIKHLALIAKQEKIDIDNPALEFIADYGDGSFRDSIGLLDQASSLNNKIALSDLEFIVGVAPKEIVDSILNALDSASLQKMQKVFETISSNGYSVDSIVKQLIKKLKNKLVDKQSLSENSRTIKIISDLLAIDHSSDQLTALEITLYSSILNNDFNNHASPKSSDVSVAESVVTKSSKITGLAKHTNKAKTAEHDLNFDFNKLWDKTIASLRVSHSTLYSIVKKSQAELVDGIIVLKTGFLFHQKALNQKKNRDILNEQLNEISGRDFTIEAVFDKNIKNVIETDDNETAGDLDIASISNIFGGGEVVE